MIQYWPFYALIGGHLTLKRSLHHPKKVLNHQDGGRLLRFFDVHLPDGFGEFAIWVFPKIGGKTPKMDDLGGNPLFSETSIYFLLDFTKTHQILGKEPPKNQKITPQKSNLWKMFPGIFRCLYFGVPPNKKYLRSRFKPKTGTCRDFAGRTWEKPVWIGGGFFTKPFWTQISAGKSNWIPLISPRFWGETLF